MKKFVIYTVMTGGYEEVSQPECIDERFDYVLFSNDFEDKNKGIWQVREIGFSLDDNKRLSRYPKSHPESLLSEYAASLYIDANLSIVDNWIYDRVVELYDKGCIYSGIKLTMTGRDCIYDHAFDIALAGVVHDYDAIVQCHELYKRGYPRHYGINENNVIYRRHVPEMEAVDKEWWWWIINFTFRDQLSYMYCLWHHNIATDEYFLPAGEDTHNSSHFKYTSHNKLSSVSSKKWVKKSVFEKIRNQSWKFNTEKYKELWYKILTKSHPKSALFFWGLVTTITNLHKFIYVFMTRTNAVMAKLKQ